MFAWRRNQLTIKAARKLMSTVMAEIYSRQTDLVSLAVKLSANLQPIEKLRVYVAICNVAPYARYVMSDDESPSGTKFLLAIFSEAEKQYLDNPENTFLEIKRLEAERSLIQMDIEFLVHRGVFLNDPYSYEGALPHGEDLEAFCFRSRRLRTTAALKGTCRCRGKRELGGREKVSVTIFDVTPGCGLTSGEKVSWEKGVRDNF